VKISNKNFSFFSTRNQYFPHIPYVASKKKKAEEGKKAKEEEKNKTM
jgi:ADP-dependent phosphofructokinase/glucokinase